MQGLGETLALYWASSGAKLILSSRSMDKLQARQPTSVAT
jgi:short-subunit dehydrogenase